MGRTVDADNADWFARGTAIFGVAVALLSVWWNFFIWWHQGPVVKARALGLTRHFAPVELDEHGRPVYDEDGHPVYKGPYRERTVVWGIIRNTGRFDARVQTAWISLSAASPWPRPVYWWRNRREPMRVDVDDGDMRTETGDVSFSVSLPAQSSVKFEIPVAPEVRDKKPQGPLRGDWELLEALVRDKQPMTLVFQTETGKIVRTPVRYKAPGKLRQGVQEL